MRTSLIASIFLCTSLAQAQQSYPLNMGHKTLLPNDKVICANDSFNQVAPQSRIYLKSGRVFLPSSHDIGNYTTWMNGEALVVCKNGKGDGNFTIHNVTRKEDLAVFELMVSRACPEKCQPDSKVPLARGQKLIRARSALLANGWHAQATELKNGDGDRENSLGTAGEFFANGFHEVEVCAGTGVSPCVFNYRNQTGACLRLFTVGEQPSLATVSAWSYDCPSKDALGQHVK
ncbi:MAG: hypothetical protein ACHP7O_06330 [Burkholderiales bacterium]